MKISVQLLEELTAATATDLTADEQSGREKLHLAGEAALLFVANKIVIPIICAFIKDVLYQKYKDIRTRGQLSNAKQEIANATPMKDLVVAESVIINDLTSTLEGEGVGRDVAESAVRSAINRARSEFK